MHSSSCLWSSSWVWRDWGSAAIDEKILPARVDEEEEEALLFESKTRFWWGFCWLWSGCAKRKWWWWRVSWKLKRRSALMAAEETGTGLITAQSCCICKPHIGKLPKFSGYNCAWTAIYDDCCQKLRKKPKQTPKTYAALSCMYSDSYISWRAINKKKKEKSRNEYEIENG